MSKRDKAMEDNICESFEIDEIFPDIDVTFAKKAVAISKKIVRLNPMNAPKKTVSHRKSIDKTPDVDSEDEATTGKLAMKALVAALESDLAAARRELVETQSEAKKTQSQLVSQLKELQAKNKFLSFHPERSKNKANKTKGRKDTMSEETAKLISELAAAKRKLKKMQGNADKTQDEFLSQLEVLQTEKDSLVADLERTRNESNDSAAKEDEVRVRLEAMGSELTAARQKLEDVQVDAEKKQSELTSQIKKLNAKKTSLVSELKHSQNDINELTTERDQMSSQMAKLESNLNTAEQHLEETQTHEGKTLAWLESQFATLRTENESLKSDLTAARLELEIRSQAKEEIQSQLKSKLGAMQAKNDSLTSELQQTENEINKTIVREKMADERVAELESNLMTSRQALEKARSDAKKTQSQLELQIKSLQKEKNDLAADLELVQSEAYEASVQENKINTAAEENAEIITEERVGFSIGEAAEQDDGHANGAIERVQRYLVTDTKESNYSAVTLEQIQEADLPATTDKVIFARALSDIASKDEIVRADAVKAISAIKHELSGKVLIAQMSREKSAQVRQECVKGLAALDMKDGVAVVEKALDDKAACVRLSAVWGLYNLKGAESAPALVRMFSDEDEGVRRRAITCIGWLGKQIKAKGNLNSQQVVATLIKRLNDPAESICKAAIGALETVTGKKFGEVTTTDNESFQLLAGKWQKWWRRELLG